MDAYEIKNIYGSKGREAALAAYPQAIADCPGDDKLQELAALAADFAHAEALSLLFEAGVSPAVTDKYAFTLLHHLALQNESRYHKKPEGAVAAAAELLLERKVSYLRKDENENMICYHYAARSGLAEFVESLAKRGAKLNMTDRAGNTGIHIACEYVRHALISLGLGKQKMERAEKNYEETLARAKERDLSDEETERYIQSSVGNAPRQAREEYEAAAALVEDYFRTVKAFADGGVDTGEKNEYGQTALDIAVKNDAKKIAAFLSGTLDDEDDGAAITAGGMTLHQAAEKGDVEAIRAIAAAGADLNALKDDDRYHYGGCTPLAVACSRLDHGAVDALLSCGADPSFKDGRGRTAAAYFFVGDTSVSLHPNAYKEKSIEKIIRSMISAGLDVNQTVDDDADTLLLLACVSARGGSTKDVIDELLRHGPDLNFANHFGATALMHTCARSFEMMENIQTALLEGGADVLSTDRNGNTALHYAARNDNKTGARSLCDMLLEFGADANAVSNGGKTALDIAVEQDNEPLVKLLLGKV